MLVIKDGRVHFAMRVSTIEILDFISETCLYNIYFFKHVKST